MSPNRNPKNTVETPQPPENGEKHKKNFITIKLLDPAVSITIKDKVIINPKEFPMGTEYTEYLDVITD